MSWVQEAARPTHSKLQLSNNRIQEQRKKKRVTAKGLGELIGSGRSTIVKLERGERRLNTDMMEKIATALGIKPADLLPEELAMPMTTGLVMTPLVNSEDLLALVESGELPTRERSTFPLSYHRQTLVCYPVEDDSIDRLVGKSGVVVVDYADNELNDHGLFLFVSNGKIVPRVFRNSQGPLRLEPFSHLPHTTIYPSPDDMYPVIGRIVMVQHNVPREITV
jgi:transcriptional regulator with XRE-family HTH domain